MPELTKTDSRFLVVSYRDCLVKRSDETETRVASTKKKNPTALNLGVGIWKRGQTSMIGKVVITSKEQHPFSQAVKIVGDTASIREGVNYVVWKFKTEDEAIRHSREFMELGFEYVQREV